MNRASLVVVNGEGTIHHGRERGRQLLKAGAQCASWGVPAVLLNAMYEANDAACAADAKQFARIYVRDSFSQRELAEHHIASTTAADLLFAAKLPESADAKERVVGVTDSVLPAVDEKLWEACSHNPDCRYLPIHHRPRLISRSRKERSQALKTRFMPTWLREHFSRAGHSTLRHAARARYAHNTLPGYAEALSQCSLLIAGRFHAACLAIRLNVPFIALTSNAHKMEALIHDVGLDERRLVAPEQLDSDLIATWLDHGYTESEACAIDAYRHKASTMIRTMFDDVATLCRRS